MRKTTVLFLTTALVLALSSGVALAASFVGTAGPDTIFGTGD